MFSRVVPTMLAALIATLAGCTDGRDALHDDASIDAPADASMPAPDGAPSVDATDSPRVAIVVAFGDGGVASACVPVSPGTTSYDAIVASGLGVVTDGTSTVCKIGPEGCDFPTQSCLCDCTAPCRVWGLYRLTNGAWVAQGGSPAAHPVTPGGVEGWAWGMFSAASGPVPPVMSFAQVCLEP